MLSLLMLLLAIMTAVTATSGCKQSAQTTVSSYRKLYVNLFGNIQGRSVRFVGVSTRGRKFPASKPAKHRQVWGHASPLKFLKLLSRKCYF